MVSKISNLILFLALSGNCFGSKTFAQVEKSPDTKEISTNAVIMPNAPKWLTASRVEKVTDRIQNKLEWSTRKVTVQFFYSPEAYSAAQKLGPLAIAVTLSTPQKQTVLLGPRVNQDNFDQIFGHELVHVISAQKYKGAIPKWLEEGLANHLSKKKKVDYAWLSGKPFPADVREMTHPFRGNTDDIFYHYIASQALAEMLDKKCDLENLIRLSVQRKMDDYIRNYCQIADLNAEFRKWVKKNQSQGL